ncbi:uncharacterized protein K452DRAFT_291847 [Aplosporella prunicola CBS 121167]|uniref:Metallo-beta-lactamase domain-containing protein n=1 Tax=Aplosporella prunicola CBS 121167 TaxID=1176127 RepID=A0A6A6B2V1_9PEZI|nr:uncharacterized protein K452DRAFT_291847 [Aplosporella prunicola CBS 121167]KAF2137051.1 hypothetical protein K452DRAFT_291847 [Aplosporella prunicola CBS 121167]
MPSLRTEYLRSSEKGLSSISTLIIGSKHAILIDPPFLLPDAQSLVSWIKTTTANPLVAIFSTHHHPDHYFSVDAVLAAFPSAKFYAAPYVCAGIEREYEDKTKYWSSVMPAELVAPRPRKPEPYTFSFFMLDGSIVTLLGPVQGDSVDHTMFWLPAERVLITGDVMYARSTHLWAEEIETPEIYEAWLRTLDLIEALKPERIVPGHVEEGWELDAEKDLEHNRKYLKLFQERITLAERKLSVKEVYDTFKNAFPEADRNLDFFLGRLSNQFGEGGDVWEENRHHNLGERTREQLQGYVIPLPKREK